MGAEYITPIGIAVTGAANQGYDFSVISLNDKDIRIFDTNKITVFELLTAGGYKSSQILGRSGHSLTYTLNGERKTIRGGGFEPAIIKVGGKSAALSDKVAGGDKVTFVPAVSGENAKLLLKDAVARVTAELGVTVNDKEVGWDYAIANLDKIETFDKGEARDELLEKLNAEISRAPLTPAARAITVTLNGESVTLPANADNSKHTFIELLNHVDMDFENPPTPDADYITTINNTPAGFSDTLREGDKAELKWR
jgi:sulfur carrier protein ThiS